MYSSYPEFSLHPYPRTQKTNAELKALKYRIKRLNVNIYTR